MPGFDDAWVAAAIPYDGGAVSPELRPLLQSVYSCVLSNPVNLAALKKSLERLLQFLQGEGRSNANCWAVDLFFAFSAGWERDWANVGLPEDFHGVLAMMGEALHDTVRSPEIARNFYCLPEQLLDRVKRLRLSGTLVSSRL
jgi:hypothetical protein